MKVLYISGYPGEAAAGNVPFIPKPIQRDTLGRQVRQVLDDTAPGPRRPRGRVGPGQPP